MTAIAIIGTGVVSPVGLSAPATFAALRGGISRTGPIASSHVMGERAEPAPATGGRVPVEWFTGGPKPEDWPGHQYFEVEVPLPSHWHVDDGVQHLVELAVPAAQEACAVAGVNPIDGAWGLFLGLEEQFDKDNPDNESGILLAALESGLCARAAQRAVFSTGRAAIFPALVAATQALSAGDLRFAVVGCVDSLVRPSRLARLDQRLLIKGENNPHGLIPGEAAAFLVLAPSLNNGVVIQGIGCAEEPTAGSERPNQGVGLTAALRGACRQAGLRHWPPVFCDLNGDRYRSLEWGIGQTRALGSLRWNHGVSEALFHSADCIGDCGAAGGALHVAWACDDISNARSGDRTALVWGASEGALRGATVLSRREV
jgi:3-oxoacyl-[acyl-carrier-protein] synthase I